MLCLWNTNTVSEKTDLYTHSKGQLVIKNAQLFMSTFLSTKWGPSILLQNCKRSLCGSICFPSTIVGNEECYKSTVYMFYSKQTWGDMGSDIQQGPTGRIWIPGGCSEDTATHHGAHTLPIVNRLHFSWWSKKFQSSKKSPGVFNAECSRTLFAGKQNTRSDTDAIHEKNKKNTNWPEV